MFINIFKYFSCPCLPLYARQSNHHDRNGISFLPEALLGWRSQSNTQGRWWFSRGGGGSVGAVSNPKLAVVLRRDVAWRNGRSLAQQPSCKIGSPHCVCVRTASHLAFGAETCFIDSERGYVLSIVVRSMDCLAAETDMSGVRNNVNC